MERTIVPNSTSIKIPATDPVGTRVTPPPSSLGGTPDTTTALGQAAAASGGGGIITGRIPTAHLPAGIENLPPDQIEAIVAAAGDPTHKPDLPR
jgi:hypothetical protein